jgi:hypothetical protein
MSLGNAVLTRSVWDSVLSWDTQFETPFIERALQFGCVIAPNSLKLKPREKLLVSSPFLKGRFYF